MAAQQMVKRRVFTDAGELIREDLAPKDLANERATLMAYWAEQDRIKAEEEAAAAAAAAATATAPAEPDPLATVVTTVAELENTVGGLAPRVEQLEQLRLASPEAVLEGSLQIARAAGAAALVEAAGQTVIAQVDAAAAAADERLAAIEGQVAAAGAAVNELVAGGREQLEQTSAEMLKRTTAAISKRIAGLEVQAAQLRGPRGDRGRVGQGLIAGAGKRPEKRPDGTDWAPGDSWLDTRSEGFQLSYMAADGSWSKPARLVPAPQLINATQNVLDMAPRTTTSISQIQTGSGDGGGGGERLTRSQLSKNNWDAVAATDRWVAAGVEPHGGGIIAVITAVDGASSGQRAFLDCKFVMTNGVVDLTVYGLLGQLLNSEPTFQLEVDVVQVGAVRVPPGITVTPLPGSPIEVRLRPLNGSANTYVLEGFVSWTLPASRGASGATDPSLNLKPAWNI